MRMPLDRASLCGSKTCAACSCVMARNSGLRNQGEAALGSLIH